MGKKFYERYWEIPAEGPGDLALKWPKLKRFIPRQAGLTVVDFGCGKGEIIGAMKKINTDSRYIGLDVSKTAIDFAQKKYPDVNFFQVEDGGKFPLSDNCSDFVFSSEVIEHVYDTENAFKEIARVLKPGGKVLLTTPYHGFIKNITLAIFAFDRYFNPVGSHVRFFSRKTLFRILKSNGLDTEKYGCYGRFYPLPHSIFVLAKKK